MPGKHRKPRPTPAIITVGVGAAVIATLTGDTAPAGELPAAPPVVTAAAVSHPVVTPEERWFAGVPHGPTIKVMRTSNTDPAPATQHAAKAAPASTHGGDSRAGRAVQAALSARGTPYARGGNTPGKGLDCSGLTQQSFKRAGISIPRTSAAQSKVGTAVSVKDLKPGDLIFYYRPVSHVAMYVGGNEIVEASRPGTEVSTRKLYLNGFAGARRLA